MKKLLELLDKLGVVKVYVRAALAGLDAFEQSLKQQSEPQNKPDETIN